MGWEIAITLGAVALLALLHLAYSTAEEGVGFDTTRIGERARTVAGDRDPWAVALVGAAAVAALFALAVVAGPALFGGSEESTPTTTPTVTAPTTSATSTTAPTTTRPTTTSRSTTTVVAPPPGTVLIAESAVSASGRVQQSYSRLGSPPVVRMVDTGIYRVLLPGLSPAARKRVTVRVHAPAGTIATVRRPATSPAFVVSTRDAATEKPAARSFLLEVLGPPAVARPAQKRKPHLPKTL